MSLTPPRSDHPGGPRHLHFDRLAASYHGARPPYPDALFDRLADEGVIGPGLRVLEIGAGSGEATGRLRARGCEVVAVEPGPALRQRLVAAHPGVRVLEGRLEDVDLPPGCVDSAVAATSLHWVDLTVALPKLAAALRDEGLLAVWRTVFGDPRVETEFRRRMHAIVAARAEGIRVEDVLDPRPTVAELEAGGHFGHLGSWQWPWHVDLDPGRIRRLFETFSDWRPDELDAVELAAAESGPTVREHYVTILHILRRSSPRRAPRKPPSRITNGRRQGSLP